MRQSELLTERKTLSDHLRVRTLFIVDPLVALLARLGVTPNMLTVFGLLVHLPVAYLLAIGRWQAAALVALLGLADALDGALARRLASAPTPGFGAFLDSTSDRVAEIVLFGGFVYYFAARADALFALLALAALGGSLMVSYTRARAEALGYPCKGGLFSRIERYFTFFVFCLLGLPQVAVAVLAAGTWITAAQRIAAVWQQARR